MMQCPRCGFENMPGLDTCARCNSILMIRETISVHPPRAGWMKSIRPLGYRINYLIGWVIPVGVGRRIDRAMERLLGGTRDSLWMLISIIPGLSHLLGGRLWRIRWLWPAWFLALFLGLIIFGTVYGSILLGTAIGLHTWIICDAGRVRESFSTMRGRLVIVLLMLGIVWWCLYGSVPRYLVRGVRSGATVPAEGIAPSDFLLIWRQAYRREIPRHGDVVLYHIQDLGAGEFQVHGGDVLGKILALPTEHIQIYDGVMTITAGDGRPAQFRIPEGIEAPMLTMDVPAGHYLCYPTQIRVQNQNYAMAADRLIKHVGLPPETDIQGRAFMIYNTIWQTRMLPRIPLRPIRQSQP